MGQRRTGLGSKKKNWVGEEDGSKNLQESSSKTIKKKNLLAPKYWFSGNYGEENESYLAEEESDTPLAWRKRVRRQSLRKPKPMYEQEQEMEALESLHADEFKEIHSSESGLTIQITVTPQRRTESSLTATREKKLTTGRRWSESRVRRTVVAADQESEDEEKHSIQL